MVIIAARIVIKYAQHAMGELPQIARPVSQGIIKMKTKPVRFVINHV